jgi:hypothetical protein
MIQRKAMLFIISLVFLISCGNSYVLSPEKLEDVLVDLHIAEGVSMKKASSFKSNEDKLNLFNYVYNKHGIDKAQFDSTMRYYSENSSDLSVIYTHVLERVAALEMDAKDGRFAATKLSVSPKIYQKIIDEDKNILPYVLNELWSAKRSATFSAAELEKGKHYEFEVDTLFSSTMVLRFTIKPDSLVSANCLVTSVYESGNIEQLLYLPVDSTMLVRINWTMDSIPSKLIVDFQAEKMNENAALSLENIRMYEISKTPHNVSLFK